MSNLHLNNPIWVWLYDYGPLTHPDAWREAEDYISVANPDIKAYPQAHTYAFKTEKEALEHPEKMGWKKDHNYILQKVYLQD